MIYKFPRVNIIGLPKEGFLVVDQNPREKDDVSIIWCGSMDELYFHTDSNFNDWIVADNAKAAIFAGPSQHKATMDWLHQILDPKGSSPPEA